MKNLKIRLGLFSLLAILAASVFFTACQQDAITDLPTEVTTNELLQGKTVVLPHGFDNTAAELEYLNQVTEAEVQKLEENYRITMFLQQVEKYGEVVQTLSTDEHIADVNLNTYLTINQLEQLQSYDPNDTVNNRANCTIQTGYCFTRKRCCFTDGWDTYCWIAWSINIC